MLRWPGAGGLLLIKFRNLKKHKAKQNKNPHRAMSQKEPWIPGGHMAVLRNGSLSFLWPNIEFSVC